MLRHGQGIMRIDVVVQNEAGSNRKHYHDEKTLEFKFITLVSRAYPYPYGFIVGTNASDGCNLDCFVITRRPLTTGRILDCEPIALMDRSRTGSRITMCWRSYPTRTSRSRPPSSPS
jgi:inorganic pyrophosphatase